VLHGPDDIELAPLPDWLRSLAVGTTDNGHTRVSTVGDVIPEGQRNATLTSLAGSTRFSGIRNRRCPSRSQPPSLPHAAARARGPRHRGECRTVSDHGPIDITGDRGECGVALAPHHAVVRGVAGADRLGVAGTIGVRQDETAERAQWMRLTDSGVQELVDIDTALDVIRKEDWPTLVAAIRQLEGATLLVVGTGLRTPRISVAFSSAPPAARNAGLSVAIGAPASLR
jgi:hypothetical protein